MYCVAGRREELPSHLFDDMGRYRHKVFVGHLGWKLVSSNGIESDDFDGPDAVYVATLDEHGQVNGVARLLPTVNDYLLKKLFPALWGGTSLPCTPLVWELSRFAAVDFNARTPATHQATAKHAAILFEKAIDVAKEMGAKSLITVSPIGMERLLRVNGYRAIRAGVPAIYEGGSIVAMTIDCAAVSVADRRTAA